MYIPLYYVYYLTKTKVDQNSFLKLSCIFMKMSNLQVLVLFKNE